MSSDYIYLRWLGEGIHAFVFFKVFIVLALDSLARARLDSQGVEGVMHTLLPTDATKG